MANVLYGMICLFGKSRRWAHNYNQVTSGNRVYSLKYGLLCHILLLVDKALSPTQDVESMLVYPLVQRRRRWTNGKPTLTQCIVSVGNCHLHLSELTHLTLEVFVLSTPIYSQQGICTFVPTICESLNSHIVGIIIEYRNIIDLLNLVYSR